MFRVLCVLSVLTLSVQSTPAFARDVTEGVDTEQGTSPLPDEHENSPHVTGKGGTIGANPQTCTDSCNRAYEGCMDQQSAVPGNGDTLRYSNNYADKLIGTSSDCSDHLRTCLNQCGG